MATWCRKIIIIIVARLFVALALEKSKLHIHTHCNVWKSKIVYFDSFVIMCIRIPIADGIENVQRCRWQ